ncbi:sec-independent protein translocase protein TatA [Agromyces sp. CF514]|uniref:Sec-independent protein translocase subunit TatA n=1 Tax=Agromyces sp. CF514 TaxID=1881031 RepID=UPI0008EBC17F|nr:Sec-independent protein translocase subunit TatA [Agromyces sp. CF514]SFR84746.1 sec-independent protein translocase protein TatA [Agromyces sp. CF514]
MLQGLTGWHLLIVVAVIVLLFGSAKLPALARSLGQSARAFKGEIKAMREDDEADAAAAAPAPSTPAPTAVPVPVPATAAATVTATSEVAPGIAHAAAEPSTVESSPSSPPVAQPAPGR